MRVLAIVQESEGVRKVVDTLAVCFAASQEQRRGISFSEFDQVRWALHQ